MVFLSEFMETPLAREMLLNNFLAIVPVISPFRGEISSVDQLLFQLKQLTD